MILRYLFLTLLAILVFCSPSVRIASPKSSGNNVNFQKISSMKFLEFTSFENELLLDRNKTRNSTVNVDDFGAKGDGENDDSQAFVEAWKMGCNATRKSILLVPSSKIYLLKPTNFSGPCTPGFIMRIQGTINASANMSDYEADGRSWLTFDYARDFTVDGGGTINGNGTIWWQNSCKIKKIQPCSSRAPTAVTFEKCTNLRVSNITIQNSQQMHLTFLDSKNVDVSGLTITSPEESPNTDGIHITSTQNIHIRNSTIETGDDCISIVSGSKSIRATNIMCGPGHGISIGSLGKDNSEANVSDVFVKKATLLGTTNGVRIKTWQGGRGYAQKITFENIVMQNVSNPIIIDQNYCDQDEPCPEQVEAVQVKDVIYRNIRGTSTSEVAINLNCSKTVPCRKIVAQNVYLLKEEEGDAKAFCANVQLLTRETVVPLCEKLEIN